MKQIPVGPKPPKIVYCFVEIPKGGTNKYEYDSEFDAFVLDRALYGAVYYPIEYGYIPKTLCLDNDPIDIMTITSAPTFPGCLIASRVIGVLELEDSGQKDNKIIAVALNDPRINYIKSLQDLSPHFKKEIVDFWRNYARLQPKKEIKIIGWRNKKRAEQIILAGIKRYQKRWGEKNEK